MGAAAPPTDVDTTGSSPEIDAQAATTAEDWTQNPYVQIEGGFLAGVSLGLVPMGGVGQQLADAGELLPHGTPEARLGLSVGMIVGGIAITAGGMAGGLLGGATTATGAGAPVGVPAMVVSTTLVVGGAGNIAAGIRGLMTTGSGGSGPKGTAPAAGGGSRSSSSSAGAAGGGRALEFPRGQLREADFPDAAQKFLGSGYTNPSPGRYVSADGLRQVRYGAHEVRSGTHHAHFEAYDAPGGRVIENAMVELIP